MFAGEVVKYAKNSIQNRHLLFSIVRKVYYNYIENRHIRKRGISLFMCVITSISQRVLLRR